MDKYEFCNPETFDLEELNALVFDGCYYYFIYCDRVIKNNCQLQQLCEIPLKRAYGYVCYDSGEQCFWAISYTENDILYQLDMHFQECKTIQIHGISKSNGNVTGIAYDCCENQLLIAKEHALYRINKNGNCCSCIRFTDTILYAIAYLSPGCILYTLSKSGYALQVFMPNNNLYNLNAISINTHIAAMTIDICCDKHAFILRYISLSEGKKPRVCELLLDENCLGYEPCKCNYRLCNEKSCKEEQPCDKEVMSCWEILESIALEEAGIAHILNAEGEKIQKAVCICTDVEELLCVNESVNDTIVNASTLEQALYAKLKMVLKLCSSCHYPMNK